MGAFFDSWPFASIFAELLKYIHFINTYLSYGLLVLIVNKICYTAIIKLIFPVRQT